MTTLITVKDIINHIDSKKITTTDRIYLIKKVQSKLEQLENTKELQEGLDEIINYLVDQMF